MVVPAVCVEVGPVITALIVVVVVVMPARVLIEGRRRDGIAIVEGCPGERVDAGQPAAAPLGRGDSVGDVREEHGPADDIRDHPDPPSQQGMLPSNA